MNNKEVIFFTSRQDYTIVLETDDYQYDTRGRILNMPQIPVIKFEMDLDKGYYTFKTTDEKIIEKLRNNEFYNIDFYEEKSKEITQEEIQQETLSPEIIKFFDIMSGNISDIKFDKKEKFNCPNCSFSAKSLQGLLMHKRRKKH